MDCGELEFLHELLQGFVKRSSCLGFYYQALTDERVIDGLPSRSESTAAFFAAATAEGFAFVQRVFLAETASSGMPVHRWREQPGLDFNRSALFKRPA